MLAGAAAATAAAAVATAAAAVDAAAEAPRLPFLRTGAVVALLLSPSSPLTEGVDTAVASALLELGSSKRPPATIPEPVPNMGLPGELCVMGCSLDCGSECCGIGRRGAG